MGRSILVALVASGLALLTLNPADAANRRAEFLPPTSNLGGYSTITCFYHVGACPPYGGYYGGDALDMVGSGGDKNVWQRFYVAANDPNYSIITQLSTNHTDDFDCDFYLLYVWAYINGQYHYNGNITFKHANTNAALSYTVEYPGNIANWLDGVMIDDSDCPWTNYHVHTASNGEDYLNPVYDIYATSSICYPPPSATLCKNNWIPNTTRAFWW